jgi:hypothetical protein
VSDVAAHKLGLLDLGLLFTGAIRLPSLRSMVGSKDVPVLLASLVDN